MRQTTRHLAVRRAAAATVSVLALGGLAACGDDSGEGDAGTDSSSQVAGESGDLEEGDEVDAAEFVRTVTDGLEASTTAHVTMTMSLGSSGEMTAEGDLDYTTDPPNVAMTMSSPLGGGDMDIRLVDGIVYVSMGQVTRGKFIEIDPADPQGPLAGMGLDGMVDQMDPGKALQNLEGSISTVVYVGEEDDLDHYEITVDPQQMLDQMGSDLPPAAESEVPDSLTYDLWLDDEGRFSKLSMDEFPLGGTSGSMEMTVSGWGEEVDIEAPAPSEITEMPELGSMMQGMNGAA
ncbi:hypothetical protein [Nocardioides pyridinolyticus]